MHHFSISSHFKHRHQVVDGTTKHECLRRVQISERGSVHLPGLPRTVDARIAAADEALRVGELSRAVASLEGLPPALLQVRALIIYSFALCCSGVRAQPRGCDF